MVEPDYTALESIVEGYIKKLAGENGWWVAKFVSPGLRGVPDRLFLRTKDEVFRCVFIEVKKFGEEPTKQQLIRQYEIRAAGAECYWVDTVEQARVILT